MNPALPKGWGRDRRKGGVNNLEALVGLNLVGGIGSIRLGKLLKFFSRPQDILKVSAEKLMGVSGIGQEIANKICGIKKEDVGKEFSLAKKQGLRIIILDDEDYPENLKNIPDPPIVLYTKGKLLPQDKLAIGIVGSRRASFCSAARGLRRFSRATSAFLCRRIPSSIVKSFA